MALTVSACTPHCQQMMMAPNAHMLDTYKSLQTERGYAAISRLQLSKTNRLLKAYATITSYSDETQTVKYQFTWYDDDGNQIGMTPWTPKIIDSSDKIQVSTVAPNAKAKTFKIRVCAIDFS